MQEKDLEDLISSLDIEINKWQDYEPYKYYVANMQEAKKYYEEEIKKEKDKMRDL
jgi:hypothetical protein